MAAKYPAFNIRMDVETKNKFKSWCAIRNKSMTEVLKEMIKEKIAEPTN